MNLKDIEPLEKNKNYLIFDISNLAYAAFYVHKNENMDIILGLAAHTLLMMLNFYYNKFKPDTVILACDRHNWRVDYTKSKTCISKKIYKGDRHKDMTKAEREKYELFKQSLKDFEDMIHENTKIICFAQNGCEADDLIAGFVQIYGKDNKITIISRDKDYIQLLQNKNVKLMDPVTKKFHSLDEWDNNVDLHLYIKCIKGGEDNIQSAYPRIWKKKLVKAWNDPFLMTTIMKHEWTNQNNITFVVEDLFKENQLLMDLTKQPPIIKKLMVKTITERIQNPGSYSYFNFLRYCGKNNLKTIAKDIDRFNDLLS